MGSYATVALGCRWVVCSCSSVVKTDKRINHDRHSYQITYTPYTYKIRLISIFGCEVTSCYRVV